MMAAPDLTAGELGQISGGLPSIVTSTLGGTVGHALLVNVTFAIAVCALAVRASAVRLVYADGKGRPPAVFADTRVGLARLEEPLVPVFIVGLAATLILVANINLPKLVELVSMIAALWASWRT